MWDNVPLAQYRFHDAYSNADVTVSCRVLGMDASTSTFIVVLLREIRIKSYSGGLEERKAGDTIKAPFNQIRFDLDEL